MDCAKILSMNNESNSQPFGDQKDLSEPMLGEEIEKNKLRPFPIVLSLIGLSLAVYLYLFRHNMYPGKSDEFIYLMRNRNSWQHWYVYTYAIICWLALPAVIGYVIYLIWIMLPWLRRLLRQRKRIK